MSKPPKQALLRAFAVVAFLALFVAFAWMILSTARDRPCERIGSAFPIGGDC